MTLNSLSFLAPSSASSSSASASSGQSAAASSVPASSAQSSAAASMTRATGVQSAACAPQGATAQTLHRRGVSQGFTPIDFDRPRWLKLVDSTTKEKFGLSYRPASAIPFAHTVYERKEKVRHSRSASTTPIPRLTAIFGNQVSCVCASSFVKDHENTTILHLTGNSQFRELTKDAFTQIAQLQSLDFLHLEDIKISSSDFFDVFTKSKKNLTVALTGCEVPADFVEHVGKIKAIKLQIKTQEA